MYRRSTSCRRARVVKLISTDEKTKKELRRCSSVSSTFPRISANHRELTYYKTNIKMQSLNLTWQAMKTKQEIDPGIYDYKSTAVEYCELMQLEKTILKLQTELENSSKEVEKTEKEIATRISREKCLV